MEIFMNTRSLFNTRSLVIMALFAAVLCVSAYISVPLPTGSHITFLNFVVLLIALLFPAEQAFLIILVWLLLGAVGVPVFISGSAGISYLLSGWGGYNFSFLVIALAVPLIRSKEYNRISYTILAIAAALAINVLGALWLMVMTQISVKQAFLIGVLPFLPLDFIKSIVVAQIIPQFRRVVAMTQPA
jgi:biotin transport system substrate-specific component